MYEKGFYWVKTGWDNHPIYEPCYYNGSETDGWGICGQDPVNSEDDFLDIKVMTIPQFDDEPK